MNRSTQKKITDEEIRKLVIERLKVFPNGKKISIGSDGEFSKEELIQGVRNQSPLGDKIIEIQLDYLRSLKEGIFYRLDE